MGKAMSKKILPIAVIAEVILSGCTDLTDKITVFDSAVSKTTDSISALYTNVDQFRRDMDLDVYKYQKFEPIDTTDENGNPTSIANRYDDQYIQVRVQAVQALGDYADQLAKLAGSDAPKKSADEINAIGTEVKDISQSISGLAGNPKLDASKYVGPITNLAAVCAQMYTQYLQHKMINQSIIDGRDAVHETCDLIKTDIQHVYQNDYIVSVNNCRNKALSYWRENGAHMPLSERALILSDIERYSDKYYELKRFNPGGALQSMEDMFDSLAEAVEGKKSKTEQAAAAAVKLDSFSKLAQQAVQQTNKL